MQLGLFFFGGWSDSLTEYSSILHQDSLSDRLLLLAYLLIAEGKVASIAALDGGHDGFEQRYPFTMCQYSELELTSGRHQHRPPFPWYPSEVVDSFMWLGSHVDASNVTHLQNLGVTHIINLDDLTPIDPQMPFTYLRCWLLDTTDSNITAHFEACHDFIGLWYLLLAFFALSLSQSIAHTCVSQNKPKPLVAASSYIVMLASLALLASSFPI